MKTICAFCGSADHLHHKYLDAARETGRSIAERGLQLWYGAGSTGVMGALADGALEAGGQVIGVIPEIFHTPVLCHSNLTHLEVVSSLHAQRALWAQKSDAFIALPGGYGTLTEFFEMLTWAQIGLLNKPVGLLNLAGYFDPLLAMIEQVISEGFAYAEHRQLFIVHNQAAMLLDALANHQPPVGLERWLTRDD